MVRPRLIFLRILAPAKSGPRSEPRVPPSGGEERALLRLRPWRPRSIRLGREASFLVGESRGDACEFPSELNQHLASLVPKLEPIDAVGAYLDLSGCDRLYPDRSEFLGKIAARTKELGLGELAAGEGPSRLVARLAASVAPAGRWWSVENAATFLVPFPLSCLADEEPRLVRALERMGVRTLGEIAAMPQELLRQALGDEALLLWREARGEGRRNLMTTGVRERLREAHSFDSPQSDPGLVASVLAVLADRLAVSLRAEGLVSGRVGLRARFHGGARMQRQRSLDPPQGSLSVLRGLTRELWTGAEERRTGVIACELRAERLRAAPATSLNFDFDRAREDLAPFIARVRDRFGNGALRWSPELWMDQEKRSP